MKSIVAGACSFAVFAAVGASSFAADVETPSSNWTGFHFGVGAGYGMVDHELAADIAIEEFEGIGPVPFLGEVAASIGYDGIGGAGGLVSVEAGYDYQFTGNYLVGLQADYTRSGIATKFDLGESGAYNLEATDTFNVLVRGGRLVDDSTLMYMIGGWTRTTMNAEVSGLGDASYDFNLSGFTLGSGVETALADNLTAKIEYRYTRYNDIDVAEIPDLLRVSAKSDIQTVRAVLSYRTGGVHKFDGDFSEADWTGFHAGVGGGAGIILHDLSGDTDFGGGSLSGLGGKGYFGSIEAGVDYQFGERFIVGLQGDYTRSTMATSLDVSATLFGIGGTLEASLEASDSFSILGRAGGLSSPNVLWYGLAGWTRTTFEGSAAVSDSDGNVLFEGAEKLTSDGLTFGVGVEGKLNDRFSMKTEYRLTGYETQDLLDTGFETDSYVQTIRTVLSARF